MTIHPHGVFYSQEMDGAYKGRHTDPGGFVQRKQTFQYVWEAREGTEGVWLYHDHGPMDPLPVYKGLFGPLIIRQPGDARPTASSSSPSTPSARPVDRLRPHFSCINGRAYAGNTPTLRGERRRERRLPRLRDRQRLPHLPHPRPPLDRPETGTVVDNQTLGPGDSITAAFIEDNPGRWFYHCHVFTHLHQGMNGWYLVD